LHGAAQSCFETLGMVLKSCSTILNQLSTKTALHRTRLRFSYQEIISVSLFFKALSPLAAAESLRLIPLTEIVERNFTFFQFCNNLKSFKLRLRY
jgi:hypothetical protein